MEKKAYLFVHFKGTESAPDEEQIYFAVSKDGLEWENVNERQTGPAFRYG